MPSITKKYRDFDLNFKPHFISGDINVLEDSEAVKRSIRNLILTNEFERPFRPKIGSGITQLLFEPVTPLSQKSIKIAIEDTIRNFEPRATLINVIVNVNPDNNGYNVNITFAINTTSEIATVDIFLERIR